MSVQVAGTKTVSFKLSYTGRTFQQLAAKIFGRDGYLTGGAVSDDGVHVTIPPVIFVQRGIVCETTLSNSALAVPTLPEPWFVLAATADDNPDSGILLSVTADPGVAAGAVVIAFKVNECWQTPPRVDIVGAAARSSEIGIDKDVQIAPVLSGADLSGIRVYKGSVVDPDGERRTLARSSDSALAASLSAERPHPTLFRTDHVALRQIEGYSSELVHLMGAVTSEDNSVTPVIFDSVTTPAKVPGYFGKRGGDLSDQWWVWGDTTTLYVQGGPAAEGFAATALVVGAATIKEMVIVGQRAVDDAVVVAYVEGLNLRLVSFDPTDGSVIDAATVIAATGAQISRVRAVLDGNEGLHIAFENDEATQQIYYMTCDIAAASFGAVGVAPTYLDVVTATNDTWPSIGVTRLGEVTIAYIQGTGTNDYGDLVIATLDVNGDLVSRIVATAATDAATAVFPDAADEQDLLSDGFTATAFDRVRRTSVVVTPQDDVYAFTLGSTGGVDYDYALIYNASFETRQGWALLSILPENTSGSINGIAAIAGEQGQIAVAFKTVVPANHSFFAFSVLQPRPFDNGRNGVGECVLFVTSLDNRVETSGNDYLAVGRGPTGSFVVNYVLGLDSIGVEVFGSTGGAVRTHPKDLYLGGWIVPPDAGAVVNANDRDFAIFNTRPKRMNFPVLVGDGGDYQGYSGLSEAAAVTRRLGGEVIIRPGTYRIGENGLEFFACVRGEGRVVLIQEGTGQSLALGRSGSGAVTISGNIVSSADLVNVRPGGIIKMLTSGFHTVVRNLGYASGVYRLLLENSNAGVPVGATAIRYLPGLGLENITIAGDPAATSCVVRMNSAYQGVMRNVRIEGETKLELTNNISSLFDNIDVRYIANTDAERSIAIDAGNENTYRALKLADGHGTCRIAADEQNPHFIGCHSDGADSTKLIYDIVAGRTTSCLFTSCTGKVTGNALTYINAMAYVNNTTGPTRSLMQMQADPLQTAAMASFFGRWGTSTILDSLGELTVVGDRLFDDFLTLDENFWEITQVGNGLVFAPGNITETLRLSGANFTEDGVDNNAVYDVSGGCWNLSTDDNELSAPLDRLRVGDRISTVQFSVVPMSSTIDFVFELVRRNLATGASATVTTSTVSIVTGAAIRTPTVNINQNLEANCVYWLRVYTDNPAGFTDGKLVGATVNSTRMGATRTEHSTNNVRLQINPFNATDSVSTLVSRRPVNTWAHQPLVRMRMAIGNLTDAELLHMFGLFAEGDLFGTAFFVHDPGNVLGLGASNQIRFVVRDDAGVYTSALTGVTPAAAPTYLYYWIGYKDDDQAYWGISTSLIGVMSAEGSVATNPANTVRMDNNKLYASVSNANAGGAVSTELFIDAVLHRTVTKFV